jgi:hypothetical protein
MMRVGELSLERFSGQLAREGVAIRWGPFVSRIVSNLPELAAPLHFLYSDFPIEPPGGICDFHTQLRGALSCPARSSECNLCSMTPRSSNRFPAAAQSLCSNGV